MTRQGAAAVGVFLLLGTVPVIDAVAVRPWRVNREKQPIRAATQKLAPAGMSYATAPAGRAHVERLRAMHRAHPIDAEVVFLLGLNLELIGGIDEAAQKLREAIALEERAEFYLNLAYTELRRGNQDIAAAAMALAIKAHPALLRHIDDPRMRRATLKRATGSSYEELVQIIDSKDRGPR